LALLYAIVRRLTGRTDVAVLTMLLAFATPSFRVLGTMLMGQAVVTMLGLGAAWAFLKWRHRHGLGWALLAGTCAGWALITRPADAVAFLGPLGILVLLRLPRPKVVGGIGLAMLACVPFLAIQLHLNHGTTGRWTGTPFGLYASEYLPGTGFGEADRPLDATSAFANARAQLSYKRFATWAIQEHRENDLVSLGHVRLSRLLQNATPHGAMLAFLPLGLIGGLASRRGRRLLVLLVAPVGLMWGLHLFYGFYLPHYAAAAVPGVATLLALAPVGVGVLVKKLPGLRVRSMTAIGSGLVLGGAGALIHGTIVGPLAASIATVGLVLSRPRGAGPEPAAIGGALTLLALATSGFAALYADARYELEHEPLRRVDRALDQVDRPALVFITPPADRAAVEYEPVFNLGVLSPDDARVIRAHDLGYRNAELVRHVAAFDPGRFVYHFDRRRDTPVLLGRAIELVNDADFARDSAARAGWWIEQYSDEIAALDEARGVSVGLPPIFDQAAGPAASIP
jgi:4-amino-4-deoxy-L-arabinose transferase-like glycosyltransferase